MANELPSPKEAQQKLLQNMQAKHDSFAQEKAWVKNILDSAHKKVKLYQALLGTTESNLCSVEDLIRSIRFRLQEHGVSTHTITVTSPLLTRNETIIRAENPGDNHPSGMYVHFVWVLTFY